MNTTIPESIADPVESQVLLTDNDPLFRASADHSVQDEEMPVETHALAALDDGLQPCLRPRKPDGATTFAQSVDSEEWCNVVPREKVEREVDGGPFVQKPVGRNASILIEKMPNAGHADVVSSLERDDGESFSMLEMFYAHRPMMFRIACRILGSIPDAEDMMQELWLRWQRQDMRSIQSAKAWLGSTVTRVCIDQLRSARRQREEYYGIRVPEPMMPGVEPETHHSADQEYSLATACAKILDILRPPERVIFMLHEVLGYDYITSAAIVGKDVPNCRQILHRAKVHLRADSRTHPLSDAACRLAKQISIAADTGDPTALLDLLRGNGTWRTPDAPKTT